jgi:hypothetical protein
VRVRVASTTVLSYVLLLAIVMPGTNGALRSRDAARCLGKPRAVLTSLV